ncbi:MAG: hypothetical protein R2939_11825 [Kofleriaceae bacterium]
MVAATELEEPRPEPLGDRPSTQPGHRTGATTGGTGRTLGFERPSVDGEPQPIVLGERDLPRLLAMALASRFTGELELAAGDVVRRIALDEGRPVFAWSNADADRLGQLLLREGKITRTQLGRALEHVAAAAAAPARCWWISATSSGASWRRRCGATSRRSCTAASAGAPAPAGGARATAPRPSASA